MKNLYRYDGSHRYDGPFRRRLEADGLTRPEQQSLGPPAQAPRTEFRVTETPEGWRKPANWDQLWGVETLIATPDGWEAIDRVETTETMRRVPEMDPVTRKPMYDPETRGTKMKTIPWHRVTPHVVWWHGQRLTDVPLASLRIPEKGERGLRHG